MKQTLYKLLDSCAHELNYVYVHIYHSKMCNVVCFRFIQNRRISCMELNSVPYSHPDKNKMADAKITSYYYENNAIVYTKLSIMMASNQNHL